MDRTKGKECPQGCKDLNRTVKRAVSNFAPPEQMTVTEWSDKYRRMSPENSAEAGPWRTRRTPYLKEIMDAFTDPGIHRLVVAASSQVGKTEMLMNMIAYMIDMDPGPAMFVLPTVDNGKDMSKRRIAPMIRDTKPLRKKVASAKSRDSDNTVLKKAYPGGMLTITGSNSPASLASIPCRYVFGDERDRWAKDAGGEGDPWGLVEARTATFYNYKMVEVSTPTVRGRSSIETSFALGTQEYWCVECPHCHGYNFIKFEHIHFKYHKTGGGRKKQFIVDSVEYACPECGCASGEDEIKKQPKKWIAKNPEAIKNGVRSFWINAFTSPWMAWEKIVLKFLDAGDDQAKLKTVVNTLFGELWDEQHADMDEDSFLNRRETYGAELPDGVLCLTCGVDTQDDRLEYEVVGYGFNRNEWGIEKGFIYGKPSEDSVWESLDGIISRCRKFKNGKSLRVSVTFVDSGGHYTQDVYERCRQRRFRNVFAIKGKGGEGYPYISPPGKAKIVKKGVVVGTTPLYIIGVDAGKEKIMSALMLENDETHRMHFPLDEERGYGEDFFSGLLSEGKVFEDTVNGGTWKWKKLPGHNRNEALDCRNYANAAYRAMNPNLDMLFRKIHEIKEKKRVQQEVKRTRKREPDSDNW